MTIWMLLAAGAVCSLVLMAAAWLMLRVSDTDVQLALRFEAARGQWAVTGHEVKAARKRADPFVVVRQAVGGLGRAVMQSNLLPVRTRTDMQQTLQSAGFRGSNAMALFVGTKIALTCGLPVAAYGFGKYLGLQGMFGIVFIGIGAVIGLVAPETIIKKRRASYLAKIEKGLSDALDLMVICSQAGLSMEPAMSRVAVELSGVHPEMCEELQLTVRELEIMADSSVALTNLGKRTGLDSLTQLTSTLVQTMQYGTPLSESLRVLVQRDADGVADEVRGAGGAAAGAADAADDHVHPADGVHGGRRACGHPHREGVRVEARFRYLAGPSTILLGLLSRICDDPFLCQADPFDPFARVDARGVRTHGRGRCGAALARHGAGGAGKRLHRAGAQHLQRAAGAAAEQRGPAGMPG